MLHFKRREMNYKTASADDVKYNRGTYTRISIF